MATLLYSEINILCMVIMVIIAIRSSVSGFDTSVKNRTFVTSVLLAAAANVFDFMWNMGLTGYWKLSATVMWLVDFMYFLSFGCSSYCWFLYTEIVQKKSKFKYNKSYAILTIPLAVLFVLLIVSYFNGCLFYFDGDGQYHRGPLFYMQQILSYGYIVVAAVKNLVNAFYKKSFAHRKELITLATFAVPPIICGIIQIFLQDLPILSVGIVISFLLAYIRSLESLILLDPLTGISNRRELLLRLASDIGSLKPDQKLYFLFVDVDEFKHINDTFGHNEGDRILREIASALEKYAKRTNGYCGRYGGDEFAMIQIRSRYFDENRFEKEIKACIGERNVVVGDAIPVEVSIGYAQYKGEADSIQDLIYRADNAMYRAKEAKRSTERGI